MPDVRHGNDDGQRCCRERWLQVSMSRRGDFGDRLIAEASFSNPEQEWVPGGRADAR